MRSPTRVHGARLFAWYAVASLFPVVLLGAVLAHGNRQDGLERALAQGRAQAAVIEETAIAPALSGDDLAGGVSESERSRLQEATDLAIYRGSIMRLRLRSFEGQVIFSDDGSVDDALPSNDPDFRTAAAGSTQAEVLDESGAGRAIRVLQPVIASANGRSIGVLEVYLPYDAVAAEVQAATVRTYWRLFGGLALLYVVLAVISWSSTQRLSRHAAQREHESLHDPLTGLPNRTLFGQRLEEMTQRQQPTAVVLVDLDRFKVVNDTLGHHAGDELLCEVARRLTHSLRTDDTVARLGGDEFGLLLSGVADPEAARELVHRACQAVMDELTLDGTALTIEASFGIALFPRHALDPESALRCADSAMYQGKRGTDGIVVFTDGELVAPSSQLSTQAAMRHAIDNDELRLHYQPQIDLRTGEVSGVEALLRWQHPTRGLLAPGDFLPAVERTGLIDPLTRWVVNTALADCAHWTSQGQRWDVAVNVSARNLDSPDFSDMVIRALRHHKVAPSRLRVEITETALAIDPRAATTTLERLATHGIGIALDDFGVGYASLAHLRSLALSEVKIDRGFVKDLGDSGQDQELVRSLVQLAHGLGLRVTAEGVESAAAAEWLRCAGCDHAQGYYFSRPVPWADLVGPRATTRLLTGTATVPQQLGRTVEAPA